MGSSASDRNGSPHGQSIAPDGQACDLCVCVVSTCCVLGLAVRVPCLPRRATLQLRPCRRPTNVAPAWFRVWMCACSIPAQHGSALSRPPRRSASVLVFCDTPFNEYPTCKKGPLQLGLPRRLPCVVEPGHRLHVGGKNQKLGLFGTLAPARLPDPGSYLVAERTDGVQASLCLCWTACLL